MWNKPFTGLCKFTLAADISYFRTTFDLDFCKTSCIFFNIFFVWDMATNHNMFFKASRCLCIENFFSISVLSVLVHCTKVTLIRFYILYIVYCYSLSANFKFCIILLCNLYSLVDCKTLSFFTFFQLT